MEEYKRKEAQYFNELEAFIKNDNILRKCKKCGLPMEVVDAFEVGDEAVSMCNNCHILHHNPSNKDCALYYMSDKVIKK